MSAVLIAGTYVLEAVGVVGIVLGFVLLVVTASATRQESDR